MDNINNSAQSNARVDLILVIVNRGFTDVVMDAARSAGAKGGTILHGRGTGGVDINKFFNIKLQEEKEIVLIVADHEIRNKIMDAILHEAGLATAAHGICMSVPIDDFVLLKDAH